ncbi:hypothetical protein P167DRAFT_547474 [Morchella conica CCBAS932]|uniref:PH domain-containing protein n=1 Tax=Morchella conica CCBAS932 TaxID=1392247 RepID=A0A3N4KI22_9PEZI|nr:hypothetical protein P167DRAFT_547474 [Morchella conica CCBAS932]
MTRSRSWSASFTNLLTSKSPSEEPKGRLRRDTFTSITEAHIASPSRDSPHPPQSRTSRPSSRPMSIVQPYQPPLLEVERDTLPELQPIFTFLNSHSKKLYTEGYFLKLNDLNPDGKPSHDRNWQECFAQLVGTVLSLWDAAELDAAKPGEEVVPTFLNLTDASIKMIDTLPTRSSDVPPLTNVLSISTAGRNRYLFHFNSHHSLTLWTAGIRLCMFEHSSLQEAYTGALIAGKGKTLNGINTIIEKTRFKYEDWARVRFGAGTPWRRCWAVITPPDEKQVKKQKALLKKAQKTGYTSIPILKGDIKFYENKKSKKSQPIATITDAFSAYAIYPQSKPLIDQSTLVKIEGKITINSDPPTMSEGFVFVMPEVHPAVSGFEMMLKWLFPTFDTFALYGRPNRLVPDINDVKSLMFAMPRERQYGYLEVADIVSLIVSEGTAINTESEWRAKLKNATYEKMKNESRTARPRTSLPAGQRFPGGTFDGDSQRSSSSLPIPASQLPPQHVPLNTPPLPSNNYHQRSTSESTGYMQYQKQQRASPSLYSMAEAQHDSQQSQGLARSDSGSSDSSLFQGRPIDPAARRLQQQTEQPAFSEVPATPTMTHPPSSRPNQLPQSPQQAPQIQRRISNNTLNEMGTSAAAAAFLKETGGSISPPSNPPHLLPSQKSQITAQSSLGKQSLEPPPGFEIQNSQVLLSGPPPMGDSKVAYEEGYGYIGQPPPSQQSFQQVQRQHQQQQQQGSGQSDIGVPEGRRPRFSWQDTPGGTLIQPVKVVPYTVMEGLESPSPHIPTQIPRRSPNAHQIPSLQTQNISRKPTNGAASADDTPKTTDSIESLARHLMSQEALDKIGRDSDDVTYQEEDTFDRRRASRLQQMLSENAENSGSEYGSEEEEEPDYSSVHTREEPPKRDADMPRAGVKKVVGTTIEPEVVVGDVHYKSTAAERKALPADIPKVDFGTTINHGRSLSAESRGIGRGGGQLMEPDATIASGLAPQGTMLGGNRRDSFQALNVDWSEHNRESSRSSAGSEKRDSWNRPSPDSGNEPHSSESSESKRRSMVWQPGMVPVAGGQRSPDRSAEQYVSDKATAAAVQQQSRSRYIHQRKASGTPSPGSRNMSSELLPTLQRHSSAFIPNGLVSSAADLSAHLSAREQEYVAKQTGSTLLHLDNGKGKNQPPHQTGLLGAIETREKEKKLMKGSWSGNGNSATVQQAIAQRQQLKQQQLQQQQLQQQQLQQQQLQQQQLQLQQQKLQQQQQQALLREKAKSPSPRMSSYGAYEGAAGYFPQNAYASQSQTLLQQQQYQQFYNQQQAYGQQQYGNVQGNGFVRQ